MSWDMRLKKITQKAEPMICDGCFHNTVCRLDGNEMLEWCSARVPSANVVEVVRCKDCKYLIGIDDTSNLYVCDRIDIGMDGEPNFLKPENDFCSRGERRKAND